MKSIHHQVRIDFNCEPYHQKRNPKFPHSWWKNSFTPTLLTELCSKEPDSAPKSPVWQCHELKTKETILTCSNREGNIFNFYHNIEPKVCNTITLESFNHQLQIDKDSVALKNKHFRLRRILLDSYLTPLGSLWIVVLQFMTDIVIAIFTFLGDYQTSSSDHFELEFWWQVSIMNYYKINSVWDIVASEMFRSFALGQTQKSRKWSHLKRKWYNDRAARVISSGAKEVLPLFLNVSRYVSSPSPSLPHIISKADQSRHHHLLHTSRAVCLRPKILMIPANTEKSNNRSLKNPIMIGGIYPPQCLLWLCLWS